MAIAVTLSVRSAWCPRSASALWTLTWVSLYSGGVWPSHSHAAKVELTPTHSPIPTLSPKEGEESGASSRVPILVAHRQDGNCAIRRQPPDPGGLACRDTG